MNDTPPSNSIAEPTIDAYAYKYVFMLFIPALLILGYFIFDFIGMVPELVKEIPQGNMLGIVIGLIFPFLIGGLASTLAKIPLLTRLRGTTLTTYGLLGKRVIDITHISHITSQRPLIRRIRIWILKVKTTDSHKAIYIQLGCIPSTPRRLLFEALTSYAHNPTITEQHAISVFDSWYPSDV